MNVLLIVKREAAFVIRNINMKGVKELWVLHSSLTDMVQTVFIEVCLNNIAEIGVSGEVFAHLFFYKDLQLFVY